MPGIVHTTVTFTTKSHVIADEIQGSFTFASSTMTAAEIAAGQAEILGSFYTQPHTDPGPPVRAANPIMHYFSNSIDLAIPAVVKCYALSTTSDDTPDVHPAGTGYGSPILVGAIALTGIGTLGDTHDVPDQVCVCLSFHGNTFGLAEHAGHGPRPAQRHRGRLFMGPLNMGAVATDPSTAAPVVDAGFLTSLEVCTRATLLDTGEAQWSVWSRANNKVDAVTGGFIDNRFDTQRRRAEVATFRQIISGVAIPVP